MDVYPGNPCVGFASPAEDFKEGGLDLNRLLVSRPCSTFLMRVSGESMQEAGICSGDILIVDRSLDPASGEIVVAVLHGEMIVRRLYAERGRLWLLPSNPDYSAFEVTRESDFDIWGVVTYAISPFRYDRF
ncbi:MAG: LexA family protein [Thermodesulfobacteriota bacterium]